MPTVRALLHDESPEIRIEAIQILSQSAPRDRASGHDLIAVLNDSDAGVQRQAIDVLRSLGPPGRRALPGVIAKLQSKDPDVRFAAAEMIGSHGSAGCRGRAGTHASCSTIRAQDPNDRRADVGNDRKRGPTALTD